MDIEILNGYVPNAKQALFHAAASKYVWYFGAIGCFLGKTLVHTKRGHIQIKDVQIGDEVLSFDEEKNELVFNKIINTFKYLGELHRPRLIRFTFKDKTEVVCTDEHEFYYEGKWVPAKRLAILAKRSMDARTKNWQPLLREQYGQNKNKPPQSERLLSREMGIDKSESLASGISSNDDQDRRQIQDYQDTSTCCRSVSSESREQANSESHRWESEQQHCQQLGVGNAQREHEELNRSGDIFLCERRFTWNVPSNGRESEGNTQTLGSLQGNARIPRERVWCYCEHDQGCSNSKNVEACQIDLEDIISISQYSSNLDVYDLEVEHTHNYVITEKNIIVHNSGKSAALVNQHLKESLEIKDSANTMSAIIAPTYKMLKNILVTEFLKFTPKEFIRSYNKAELTIELKNSHKILFLAGDTEKHLDRLRGLNLTHVSIDEIQLFDEYVFQILVGRLRDKKGSLRGFFGGSPRGRNWIYTRLVEKANDYKNTDTWIHTTTYDNKDNLPAEYIRDLEQQYTGRFKEQELFGMFVASDGLVYSNFNRQIHVIDTVVS